MYNLSEHQGDKDRSFRLDYLDPGQNYEVWIRAITDAGPGPKSTVTFKTEDLEGFGTVTVSDTSFDNDKVITS